MKRRVKALVTLDMGNATQIVAVWDEGEQAFVSTTYLGKDCQLVPCVLDYDDGKPAKKKAKRG